MKLRFSGKFYGGILLIVLNFAMGKIAQVLFFLHLGESAYMWGSVVLYVSSWIPLVIGVWWIGQEYADAVQKYFSLKFYHESLKRRTKKVSVKVKSGAKRVSGGAKKVISKGKERVLRKKIK